MHGKSVGSFPAEEIRRSWAKPLDGGVVIRVEEPIISS
jgi:hypothetical protein